MIRRLAAGLFFAFPLAAGASPAHLPIRHYTSADGLAHDAIVRIRFDREGFLWIATAGGLSLFDGTQFTGFGPAEGLRGRTVGDLALGVDGTDWVATDAGLFSFRPGETAAPGKLFREVPLPGVPEQDHPFRLLADLRGRLWVGTLGQLWRVERAGERLEAQPVPLTPPLTSRVQALAEDPTGAIWVGTHASGIYRVRADGGVDHYPVTMDGANFVRDFFFPGDGSVWTAFFGGIAIFPRPPFGPGRALPRILGSREGMEIDTTCLLPTGRDRILVGTTTGIVEMRRDVRGTWGLGTKFDRRSGLPQAGVTTLSLDPAGNLWAGLGARGLVKILGSGFSTYDDPDTMGSAILDLTTDRGGNVVVLASNGAKALTASQPAAVPSAAFSVSLPRALSYVGWGGSQKMLRDSRGDWWLATGSGVLRYGDARGLGPRRLARPPDAVYRASDGLSGDDAFVLGEDARGDVWASLQPIRPGASALSRWSRQTGRFTSFPAVVVGSRELATHFFSARDGTLWILFLDGRLLRFREGVFEPVHLTGLDDADLYALFQDGEGRLWLLGRAVYVCDHPGATTPRFAKLALGLDRANVHFRCGLEDAQHRIWLGSNQGLVTLERGRGKGRWFTVEDGLVGNAISLCLSDGTGALWFSDQSGLSRLDGPAAAGAALSPARLRDIRIAGEPVPLPSLGTTATSVLPVPWESRRLSVEFSTVEHGRGPVARFQYRLDRPGQEWSAPASTRRVHYAQLEPGRYRLLVRTVGEDGAVSAAPASLSLDVQAPPWQRAWFLATCLAAAAAAVYSIHRVRVARAIAMERVRTRIATDLHDDVGTSLSQIAILSQLSGRRPELQERITALAGEVIDSLGDAVWAISPRADTLGALVTRMRRFASELFADDAVALTLALPEGGEQPIDPEARRQLYLVFKEALHNVRRHADARNVRVELRRGRGEWCLTVEEDGRGFDAERSGEGHGLASMRRRAERVGGRLTVASSPQGTRVTAVLPEVPARA